MQDAETANMASSWNSYWTSQATNTLVLLQFRTLEGIYHSRALHKSPSFDKHLSKCIPLWEKPVYGLVAMGLYCLLASWWEELSPSDENHIGQDLLEVAISFGQEEVYQHLINRGVAINSIGFGFGDHMTPVGKAIDCRNLKITRLLLERGADPNLVRNECTFLCRAVQSGTAYIQLLLEFGADPYVHCRSGCGGALFQALRQGNIEFQMEASNSSDGYDELVSRWALEIVYQRD